MKINTRPANPYMATFSILGGFYLVICTVSVISGLTGSLIIGAGGFALCSFGWKFSKDNLV